MKSVEDIQEVLKSHVKKYKILYVNEIFLYVKYISNKSNKNYSKRDIYIYNFLNKFKKSNKYIDCKTALKIFEISELDKTDYYECIVPFIVDWWNMDKKSFCLPALCYFGDFGDYHPSTGKTPPLPIRLPNEDLYSSYPKKMVTLFA